jgi:hypothetical protein
MSGPTRRSVLAALGGMAALAGCTGGGTGGDADGTDGDGALAGGDAQLGRLRVTNNDDTPHRVAVQVERDGEVASWTTHDLDARSAGEGSVVTVLPEGSEAGAEITVEVQLDGERIRQFTVGGGCRNVLVEIDGEGEMTEYSGDCSGNASA